MNMGKKDLDTWGRSKARSRYESGGSVRPEVMDHAKARLAKKFHEQGNTVYRGPDIPNPRWRDPVAHHPMAVPDDKNARPYDSTKDRIKTGGRIKK